MALTHSSRLWVILDSASWTASDHLVKAATTVPMYCLSGPVLTSIASLDTFYTTFAKSMYATDSSCVASVTLSIMLVKACVLDMD